MLKKSEEQALGAVSTDFISECLCFYMVPKAEDTAASLVLCLLGHAERQQQCLEPSVSSHWSGSASQARTKPAHSSKLVPL